jgi:hypothetical protein
LAELRHDYSAAELHFAEAAALEPSDFAHQLNLTITQLHSKDETKQDQARTKLAALQEEPSIRLEASRVLLGDALDRQQFAAAVKIADKMETYPDLGFVDRLLCLAAIQKAQDPRFSAAFAAISGDPRVKSEHAIDFTEWMIANNLAEPALNWVSSLKLEGEKQSEIRAVSARVYIALGDWTGLERFAKQSRWDKREFLRRAYLARALREQGQELASRGEQTAAVKAAAASPALTQLAQLFLDWGWEAEATELFWRLADDPRTRGETLQTLYRHYSAKSDTRGLYNVMLHLGTAQPDDLDVQNNVALLSFLLGMNIDRAHKIAVNIYGKNPANPAFASTYALSRYLKGDKKMALRVMNSLPPEQLHEPAIAAYYGVILAGSDEPAKAQEFLTLAENASLLPEERALVANARQMARPIN